MRISMHPRITSLLVAVTVASMLLLATACSGGGQEPLTLYVGRSQQLVQPLLEQFSKDTGIPIRVRYGDGTDLALAILEEGDKSPADIYYGQDVGALGAIRDAGLFQPIDQNVLEKIPAPFRSPDGTWMSFSGRARVIAYHTSLDPKTLPKSALEYADPKWRNRLGIVPRSDGFPEFVTALRVLKGDQFALDWLIALRRNNPKIYANNIAAITGVSEKEIEIAFSNHYYLYRFLDERGESFPVRNQYFDNGDVGGLFLVAGAGILKSSSQKENAQKFFEYMLDKDAQEHLTKQTKEYPMVPGASVNQQLPSLDTLKTPELDLSRLGDLRGSLELMRQAGLLP